MRTRIGVAAATVGLLGAGAAGAATLGVNATAYSLGDEGSTLVTVASASGVTASVGLTAGGRSVSLDGIDYRPETGVVYGYDDGGNAVYTVDLPTGQLTLLNSQAGLTNDDDLDLDFNPVVDAVRIVTGQNENVVYNPTTNAFVTSASAMPALPLFYGAGDVNEGTNPDVVFNAYTNSNAAVTAVEGTQQYVIDTELDVLATLANNAGTLGTVGTLAFGGQPFDVTEFGGFDILSLVLGSNTAYALLGDATGMQSIYTLDLFADAMGFVNLTKVTDVTADFGTLDGFTLVPAPVPVPAAGLLLLGGLGSLAWLRRRRAA